MMAASDAYNLDASSGMVNPTALRWRAGAGSTWSPLGISGVVSWLTPRSSRHMMQESLAGISQTPAAAHGDLVGEVYDPVSGKRWVAAADARRPTVTTSVTGRNVMLNYVGGTSSNTNYDALACENSKHLFVFIPTLGEFTIMLVVKATNDSNDGVLLDSCNLSGAGNPTGFALYRTNGNKLQYLCYQGSGTPAVNITTVADAVLAANLTFIKVTGSGTANPSVRIVTNTGGTDTVHTFGAGDNNFTAAAFAPLTYNLTIGQGANTSASSGAGFHGDIGDVIILNRVVGDSDDEWVQFKQTNAAFTSASLSRALADTATLDPDELPFLAAWWDFSDSTKLWQEHNARTTQTAPGDPIGTLIDARDTDATFRYNEGLSAAASDATRPIYSASAVQNGLRAATFTPADSDLLSMVNAWQKRGRGCIFIVAKNSDTATGSHFIRNTGGTAYWVQTGESYEDGNGDDSRFVVHFVDGSVQYGKDAGVGEDVTGDGWHVYELYWDGTTATCAVDGAEPTTVGPMTFVSTSVLAYDRVGPTSNPGFEFDGYAGEYVFYRENHEAALRAKVRQKLATKWGITLAA